MTVSANVARKIVTSVLFAAGLFAADLFAAASPVAAMDARDTAAARSQGVDPMATHALRPAPLRPARATMSICAHRWQEMKRSGEAAQLIWRDFWAACSQAR